MNQILVHPEPTSNPNAVKFNLNRPINSHRTPLTQALQTLSQIENIHFFENSITVFKKANSDWGNLIPQVEKVILENMRANE